MRSVKCFLVIEKIERGQIEGCFPKRASVKETGKSRGEDTREGLAISESLPNRPE
jgi:hypothetical protein